MKKFTKVSLVIVAIFFIIGFILITCGAAMGAGPLSVWSLAEAGDFGWGKWHIGSHGIYYGDDEEDDDVTEDYKEFAASTVKKLILDVDAAEIVFTESDDSDIISVAMRVGSNVKKYSAIQDGDVLKINCTMKHYKNWYVTPKLTVSLPENIALETADLAVGASDIDLEHGSVLCDNFVLDVGAGDCSGVGFEVSGRTKIKLGVGEISLEGGKYNELKMECGIGTIEFSGEVTGDVTAECGMGEIDMWLQAREEDYNYDIKCGMGSIEINGVTYGNISGKKVINHDGAVKKLVADCGMGSIEIEMNP